MNAAALILVVNSNRRNLELLGQFLVKNGCTVVSAASLDEFDWVLQGTEPVRLALVDITDFDSKIWERCESLRKKGIPFLMVSPRHSNAIQQEGIKHGAQGVLVKPLVTRELLSLIRSLLEED